MNKLIIILALLFSSNKLLGQHGGPEALAEILFGYVNGNVVQYHNRDSVLYGKKLYSRVDCKRLIRDLEKTNYDTYYLPGVGYSIFQPKGNMGAFSGLSIEYLFIGWAEPPHDDKLGLSHFSFYGKLDFLKSNQKQVSTMYKHSLGFDFSFGKKRKRSLFIPYLGFEFGRISQKELGNAGHFSPILGIHLIPRKNAYLNLYGGYVATLKKHEQFQGWFTQVSLKYTLW